MIVSKRKITSFSVSALLALCLGACGHHVPAPVVHLNSSSHNSFQYLESRNLDLPPYHQVEAGDTLFSIAWKYGVDFRELARLNNIESDYRIYPGQKLHFVLQQIPLKPKDFDAVQLQASVRQALGLQPTPLIKPQPRPHLTSNVSKRSYPEPVRRVRPEKKQKNIKKTARQYTSKSGKGRLSNSKISRWYWPVKGRIVDRFSRQLHGNKGVDISGKLGEPVRAAASGRVVYRGNSLKGYGNLVIVKHNDDYLSAYAHNSRIHVQENEIVKAGQIIADIGNSGTDQNKLHFEIRYQGKPVDPVKYLPKL